VDIVKNLPKLRFIWIYNQRITDFVLNSVSKLPKIQTIKLYGNEDYTQTGVQNVRQVCPKLNQFYLIVNFI